MNTLIHRRGTRGAALVESLIVISFFILATMGIIYFKNIYTQKVRVARLARAGAISYSMRGCEGSPTQNVQSDMSGSTGSASSNGTEIPYRNGTNVAPQGSDKATGALQGIGGTQNSFMNPIGSVNVSGTASARIRGALNNGFRSTIPSTSFVSCGDVVRDGQYDEVVGYVSKMF